MSQFRLAILFGLADPGTVAGLIAGPMGLDLGTWTRELPLFLALCCCIFGTIVCWPARSWQDADIGSPEAQIEDSLSAPIEAVAEETAPPSVQISQVETIAEQGQDDLQMIIDNMAMGVVLLDHDLNILKVNKCCTREIWQVGDIEIAKGVPYDDVLRENRRRGASQFAEGDLESYIDGHLSEIADGDIAPRNVELQDGRVITYAGTAFSGSVESAKQVANQVYEIAAVAKEQTDVINQVFAAIADMYLITQKNAALFEETTGAVKSAIVQTDDLQRAAGSSGSPVNGQGSDAQTDIMAGQPAN